MNFLFLDKYPNISPDRISIEWPEKPPGRVSWQWGDSRSILARIEIFNFKSESEAQRRAREIKEKCQHEALGAAWERDLWKLSITHLRQYFLFKLRNFVESTKVTKSPPTNILIFAIDGFSRWILNKLLYKNLLDKKFSTHQEYFRSQNKNP